MKSSITTLKPKMPAPRDKKRAFRFAFFALSTAFLLGLSANPGQAKQERNPSKPLELLEPYFHRFPHLAIPYRLAPGVQEVKIKVFVQDQPVLTRSHKSTRAQAAKTTRDSATPRDSSVTQSQASLLILLDISGSMGKKKYAKAKAMAQKVFHRLNRRFAVALGTFGDYIYIPSQASSSWQIRERLSHTELSEKKTLLHEALLQGLLLGHEPNAILVITDGKEEGSEASLQTVVRLAQKKDSSIIAYGVEDNKPIRRLAHAAISTGGKFFPHSSSSETLIRYLQESLPTTKTPSKSSSSPQDQNGSKANNSTSSSESRPSSDGDSPKSFEKAPKGKQHELMVDLSTDPSFLWQGAQIRLEAQSRSHSIQREWHQELPWDKGIAFLAFAHPYTFFATVGLVVLVLVLGLLYLFLRRRSGGKAALSTEEVNRLKELAYKETLHKAQVRQEDSETYNKLYERSSYPQRSGGNNSREGVQAQSQRTPGSKASSPQSPTSSSQMAPKGRLVVENGSLRDQSFPLYQLETIVGADRECTIALPDARVSPQHCKVKNIEGEYVLFDMVSQNGTFLNDKKLIRPKKLHDMDRIVIGDTSLVFRSKEIAF